MSSDQIFLTVALAGPALVFTLLRINAALVFLSLCLGAVLVEYVAGEANSLITLFSEQAGSVSASTIQLVLLLAPAVVTGVVTVFSVRNKIKMLFNVVPAICAAAFALIVAVPLLPTGISSGIQGEAIWDHLVRSQALIVGVGAIVSLAFLWFQRHHMRQHDKGKKHR